MRAVRGGGLSLRSVAPVVTLTGMLGLLAPGCRERFDGPYPCEQGYASCVNPQQNQCETNLTNDGLNCGACGQACALGAPCTNSQCGAGATRLAALAGGAQTSIALNSTGVFWSQSNTILTVALTGGAPTTVASNGFSCAPGVPFAVDESNVYYVSTPMGGGPGPGPTGGGLAKQALSDGSVTILVPVPPTGNGNLCGSIAVDANNVYVLANQQKGPQGSDTLSKVSVAGGPVVSLAMAQGSNGGTSNGLAVTPNAVVFLPPANGPRSVEVVPIAGGAATSISVAIDLGAGISAFTADAANVYVVGSGCCCNCNGGSGNGGLPTGGVAKLPLDGGPGTVLAQVSGQVGGIAVDSANVYWSTDSAVWKVPITGGVATTIAGNLTNGGSPSQCNGSCGGGSAQSPNAIAVDATSVYIADTAANVNALLKVAK